MKALGLLMALCGWLLPVAGLTWTDSATIRLVLCLTGMTLCLLGILGFVNGSYLKTAIWKK
ncbi:MAG: hypothetical protein ACE145_03755 [Terriglobia bacterium]